MTRLRQILARAGLERVETLLASGNVVFDVPGGWRADIPDGWAGLERRVEAALAGGLGYEVATFVRFRGELRSLVEAADAVGGTAYVVFTRGNGPAVDAAVQALETSRDRFVVREAEILWFLDGRLSESPLFGSQELDRALPVPNTMRNMTTVRRVLERMEVGA